MAEKHVGKSQSEINLEIKLKPNGFFSPRSGSKWQTEMRVYPGGTGCGTILRLYPGASKPGKIHGALEFRGPQSTGKWGPRDEEDGITGAQRLKRSLMVTAPLKCEKLIMWKHVSGPHARRTTANRHLGVEFYTATKPAPSLCATGDSKNK